MALKVLAAGSAEYAERFRSEARALERLSHPGLTRVHDFGVASDGRCYSAMELLEGETLEGYLARLGGCDWREALGVADKMLAALEAAHAAGLVHRDIKPANVFLTLGGEVKLLDFGIARGAAEAGATSEAVGAATVDGVTLFGTPEYMAPEQAASGQVDHRADIYALGCVLYEMLTGRIPFAEGSAVAILDAKTKGSPERPRERRAVAGIPDPVDELVCERWPATHGALQSATDAKRSSPAWWPRAGGRRTPRPRCGRWRPTLDFASVLLGTVREVRTNAAQQWWPSPSGKAQPWRRRAPADRRRQPDLRGDDEATPREAGRAGDGARPRERARGPGGRLPQAARPARGDREERRGRSRGAQPRRAPPPRAGAESPRQGNPGRRPTSRQATQRRRRSDGAGAAVEPGGQGERRRSRAEGGAG